ncbi:MAG: CarD family transcriptional regulator [bacterium]|nr:CarD family transcriptional regulator [bacterium]
MKKPAFQSGDFVVYPAHGVGHVSAVESHEVAGQSLDMFVIKFNEDRMTLRLPVAKALTAGLRSLSSKKEMDGALKTLKTQGRVRRTMWSRRAQEYEAKINSGNPGSVAEVVRDLHRNADQAEQSYSERQLYQAALCRLSKELAAIEITSPEQASIKIEKFLKKKAA